MVIVCVGAYAVAFCAFVVRELSPASLRLQKNCNTISSSFFFEHTQVPFAHGYEEYIPGVIGFANELQRYVVKQVRLCASV